MQPAISLLFGTVSLFICVTTWAGTTGLDPFLWLEDVHGDRALRWVQAQNQTTLAELQSDPEFDQTRAAAGLITGIRDAIPRDQILGGKVYGFTQNADHPRGVWWRTTLEMYKSGASKWELLIDLDAVSFGQNTAWNWQFGKCLSPEFSRCLIGLSRPGAEGVVVREYDIATKSFVSGGFDVGEGQTQVEWVDSDTVLIATNWGRESLTRSGAPRTVRIWSRGQNLRQAQTVYEGAVTDLSVVPKTFFSETEKVSLFVVRRMDASTSQFFHVDESGRAMRITVPATSQFRGLFGRQALFQLTQDWRIAGQTSLSGSLVSFSLDRYLATGGAMPKLSQAYVPDSQSSLTGVSVSSKAVFVSLMEKVQGRVNELTFDGHQWLLRRVAFPDNGAVEITSASNLDEHVMLKFSSFLTPDRLFSLRPGHEPEPMKQLQSRFDANGAEVQQLEAVSSDGARIPYFVIRKTATGAAAATPTLLYAYGGFQISTTPWYWSSAGKLWLEKGGAYVIANIRGGGEFGWQWHAAATGKNRQTNFDDLAAVAQDLIARGLTSPRRLGIFGSSQGGLLVAGTFVQHPELFNAVVSQVPLTDMLRYTKLAASNSLTAEYGDPSDPLMRDIIAQWSPYQNVRAGVKYPNVFFMTSAADDRIHPGHARKMAAKMEAMGQPVLFYEDNQAADASQRAEQLALTFTYFRRQLMN